MIEKHLNNNPGCPDEEYDYFVSNYEYSFREGSGEGWGWNKKEEVFYKYYLGHCSCYGPFENGKGAPFTKKEVEDTLNGYGNKEALMDSEIYEVFLSLNILKDD